MGHAITSRRARRLFGALLLVAAGEAAAIVGGTPTASFAQVSNGVQFSDNWVLTARHLGIGLGDGWANGYGASTVAAVYDLPGPGFPQNDLTLLRLLTPIAAPTLSLGATLLAAGTLTSPLDVTIVTGRNQVPRGYGWTQLGQVWDRVDPDDSGPLGDVPVNWLVAYTAGSGEPYVQGGDSGGGLFLGHVGDSTTPLLGITSALIEDDTVHGITRGSAFVQLAAYRDWIDATMANDLADNQTARWVATSVPEPSTLLLWAAGLALVARHRRLR